MPLMPEQAAACREWQGKGAHYNVHQAWQARRHLVICTCGPARAHYNGTTGTVGKTMTEMRTEDTKEEEHPQIPSDRERFKAGTQTAAKEVDDVLYGGKWWKIAMLRIRMGTPQFRQQLAVLLPAVRWQAAGVYLAAKDPWLTIQVALSREEAEKLIESSSRCTIALSQTAALHIYGHDKAESGPEYQAQYQSAGRDALEEGIHTSNEMAYLADNMPQTVADRTIVYTAGENKYAGIYYVRPSENTKPQLGEKTL
ncbi:hypothetical protein B0H14DRAFT_2579221 [Mycena olivaceomarginata]|nr:hypothetical protein B0H14DRAFT_2579221 [Mycena olivaceomarginata]